MKVNYRNERLVIPGGNGLPVENGDNMTTNMVLKGICQ
jgi:hypothetical protein